MLSSESPMFLPRIRLPLSRTSFPTLRTCPIRGMHRHLHTQMQHRLIHHLPPARILRPRQLLRRNNRQIQVVARPLPQQLLEPRSRMERRRLQDIPQPPVPLGHRVVDHVPQIKPLLVHRDQLHACRPVPVRLVVGRADAAQPFWVYPHQILPAVIVHPRVTVAP